MTLPTEASNPCDVCGCEVYACAGQLAAVRNENAQLRDALAVFAAGKVQGQTIPPLARNYAKRVLRPETTEAYDHAAENAERTEAMAQAMERGRR